MRESTKGWLCAGVFAVVGGAYLAINPNGDADLPGFGAAANPTSKSAGEYCHETVAQQYPVVSFANEQLSGTRADGYTISGTVSVEKLGDRQFSCLINFRDPNTAPSVAVTVQ